MRVIKPLFKITFVIIVLFIISYVVGYLTFNKSGQVPDTVENDTTLPSLTIKDYKFHCQTFGSQDNKMILVLHGGPGADFKYLLNLKSLSDSFFVVFYDQRGSGLSERTEDIESLGYDTALADINSIINYFKPEEKVFILGHSWGGMLGAGYLGHYPTKVEKLIIAEPGFLTPQMADKYFIAVNGMRPEFSFSSFKYLMKSYFESIHTKKPDSDATKDYLWQKLMFGNYEGHPLRKYFCNQDMGSVKIPFNRAGALASQYMMASGFDESGKLIVDFTSGIDTLNTPVLMIASECNSVSGISFQKEHLKLFNNANMIEVKNSGHYMLIEQEMICEKVIREFLNN